MDQVRHSGAAEAMNWNTTREPPSEIHSLPKRLRITTSSKPCAAIRMVPSVALRMNASSAIASEKVTSVYIRERFPHNQSKARSERWATLYLVMELGG